MGRDSQHSVPRFPAASGTPEISRAASAGQQQQCAALQCSRLGCVDAAAQAGGEEGQTEFTTSSLLGQGTKLPVFLPP